MKSTQYNGLTVSVSDLVYVSRKEDATGFEVLDIAEDGFTLGIRDVVEEGRGYTYARQEIDVSFVVSVKPQAAKI